jgi:hypothetical protein
MPVRAASYEGPGSKPPGKTGSALYGGMQQPIGMGAIGSMGGAGSFIGGAGSIGGGSAALGGGLQS